MVSVFPRPQVVVILTPDGFGKPRNRGEPISLFSRGGGNIPESQESPGARTKA